MIIVILNGRYINRMTDIFISYSRHDQEWVARFAKALEDMGYVVWWDTRLLAGDDFHHTIPVVLDEARCVVVVWSKVSVERDWVRAEAYRGNERKVLIPVQVESVQIPLPFNLLHAEDMERWDGKPGHPAFQRLLRAIARYCPSPQIQVPVAAEQRPEYQILPVKVAKAGWWAIGVTVLVGLAGLSVYLLKNGEIKNITILASDTSAEKRMQARAWLESETKSQWGQAINQLQSLADSGDAEAKRLLGFAYYNGRGVAIDKVQGCHWYKQAVDAGSTDAREAYAKLCS